MKFSEFELMGVDSWCRPVYRDPKGRLWKDINCGDTERPCLHSAVNNDFEGEPNVFIKDVYPDFEY